MLRDDALRRDLDALLANSAAPHAFHAAVRQFAADARVPAIEVAQLTPRLKVLRLIAQLLHQEPDVAVARIQVDGRSGCCDFRGILRVTDAAGVTHQWRFVWDCRWRAQEAGLYDRWGQPDQSRAAREFGWRCFSEWRRVETPVGGSSLVEERP